jgi:starvation-inducible DNA-binding protein
VSLDHSQQAAGDFARNDSRTMPFWQQAATQGRGRRSSFFRYLSSGGQPRQEPTMDAIVTKNDLKSDAKKESIDLLNARLADAIHEMLDEFREEIDGHVDIIAERAVQLGGTAHGTSQDVAKATKLKAYPTDIHKTKDHLAALIDRYAAAAKLTRAAIDEAADAGDADTADIFTAYSRSLDKLLWFLEAHTQEKE